MKNYDNLRTLCQRQSELSAPVIDDFLIYFAAEQHKLDRKFDKSLAPFRHITWELQEEWLSRFKVQHIAHRIFKKDGLIGKYLNHSGLRHLSEEEMNFLKFQKEHPWRFSFSQITGQPEADFFEMYDIFTGENYLLFSPSITSILQTQQPLLWFNLISFNDGCRQTYGPVLYFNSFEPEDILFYARETNGDWYETGEEVMEDLEDNPLPFSMLISGSNQPLVFHDEYQIVISNAEYEIDEAFNSDLFRNDFLIEYSHGVYKLSLKEWGEFPHYSAAFYDEGEELLFLYAMTDAGFRQLVETLNRLGYTLENEPDERINIAMQATASSILKRKSQLNRYEHLFATDTPAEKQEGLDQMNALLAELIPYINSGEKPDIEALSAKYSTDPAEVRDIYEMVKKKVE